MTSNQRVDGCGPGARQLAEMFHERYERLAPHFGYETRKETRVFDPASNNGRLMIAVCDEILTWFDLLDKAEAQTLLDAALKRLGENDEEITRLRLAEAKLLRLGYLPCTECGAWRTAAMIGWHQCSSDAASEK
jgi:hypothetical protein